MSNTVNPLTYIHTLDTLSMWTPFGGLMNDLHCFLNGQQQPYVKGSIFPSNQKTYTSEEILEALGSRGEKVLSLWVNTDRQITLEFKASVTSAFPLPEFDTLWILTLKVEVEYRHQRNTIITSAKMVCLYDCSCGRGFIMIPELVMYQLHLPR